MPRVENKDYFMSVSELAKCLGKSSLWVTNELRLDSEREHKQFPFAIATKNKETGTWSYRIFRRRFQRWLDGQLDSDEIADKVAKRVLMGIFSEKNVVGVLEEREVS